jgi:protein O-GlcNAc transferase
MASLNPGFTHRREAKNKITVGYLSNTFKNHPGGHLIAGLFERHDKEQFRVICYSYGEDDQSYFRKKAEENVDLFRDIRTLDDLGAAKVIFDDGVDILVDLRGHTGGSRMGICALKPAPVQAVYLGCPSTSGADFFDYLIADKVIIPDEDRAYYSEKIVFMPDCYQVTNNEQSISNEAMTRKDQELPEEGVVFCSFNTAYKIEPVMFDCWVDILKQVPDSVLWLLKDSDLMVENLRNEIKARGLSPDRLVFGEKMSKERHLRRIQLADLALDTRMVNGHVTTSDAIWAGVPVVTVLGHHFASRVSASILKAAGLPELVTENCEEYKALAVDFALNKEKILSLKKRIDETRGSMPLFNTSRFVSDLEKAYHMMWQCFIYDEPHHAIEL